MIIVIKTIIIIIIIIKIIIIILIIIKIMITIIILLEENRYWKYLQKEILLCLLPLCLSSSLLTYPIGLSSSPDSSQKGHINKKYIILYYKNKWEMSNNCMKNEKKVLSVLHSSHPTKFLSFSNFPTTCNTWTKMEKGNKCTENHLYILLQECLLTSPAKCCCEISSSDWWTGTLKTEKKIER